MQNIKPSSLPKLKPVALATKHKSLWLILYVWLAVGRQWEVAEDWQFATNDGTVLFIPKGFVFNGASIPRFFRFILSPVGLLFIPSVFHDYAYVHNHLLEVNKQGKVIKYRDRAGKASWDKLFYKLAKQINGFSIIGKIARLALAIGGHLIWKKHHGSKFEKRIAKAALKITGILNVILPLVFLILLILEYVK